MSAADGRQQTSPAAPPPLSAGEHEMRDYYAPQDAARPPPNQEPYLTPYLGLRARLSQIWINRWTILLLLVLVRTLFAIGTLDTGIAVARKEALASCTSVEQSASTMASMPHYMAAGVNHMTAEGITNAVRGLLEMLSLTVTGVEMVVVFVISFLTDTYLCLITLAASGGAHLMLDIAEDFSNFMNSSLATIENDLAGVISGFVNDVNKFFDILPGIPFINHGNKPHIDITNQMNALKSLQWPPIINQKIEALEAAIPDFAQVKSALDDVIRLPFEELKMLIDNTRASYSFDANLLHVPPKAVITFCSDNNGINNFFDAVVHTSHIARNVFYGVLLLAAALACVPMAWWEIKRWRHQKEHADIIGREAIDPLDAVYISSRPYTSQFGIYLASKTNTKRHQMLIRWVVAYCTSLPALFVLSLALAGLFSCLCQYVLLRSVQAEVPALSQQVGSLSQKVIDSLDKASVQWATDTNNLIATESQKINLKLFGWVNTSTVVVNNTLNEFVDRTINTLDTTFGNTVLAQALVGVFNCLIGFKIRGIEDGLTWVHDHAYIDFPLLPPDVFTLNHLAGETPTTADNNFLADPKDETAHAVMAAITVLINHLMASAREEAIIATILLGFWVIVFLMGVIRAAYLFFKHDKMRGEGGDELLGKPRRNFLQRNRDKHVSDGPSPPYNYATSDVNLHAPYTLNPHPFPRDEPPSAEDDAELEKKSSSSLDARSFHTVAPLPHEIYKSMHGAVVNDENDIGNPFDEKHDNGDPFNEKNDSGNSFHEKHDSGKAFADPRPHGNPFNDPPPGFI